MGKFAGHARQTDRLDAPGNGGGELVERRAGTPHHRCPHLGDERGQGRIVERRRVVVDRRVRQAGLDELDAPPIDDVAVGRGGHRDRPPEVIEDAEAHPVHSAGAADAGVVSTATSTSTRFATNAS